MQAVVNQHLADRAVGLADRQHRVPSKPATANTPPWPPERAERCVSTTNTTRRLAPNVAGWDIHRGRLSALRTHRRDRAIAITHAPVMTTEPYPSALRDWIVDNGSSHRGQGLIDRLTTDWANTRLVHLPLRSLLRRVEQPEPVAAQGQ